jgi:predicted AlkP superfamily pyrophosphatase or phosphodiesterase
MDAFAHTRIDYGASTLADVLPSALAALGVEGEPNALRLPPSRSVVVVLVDGLGWNLLRAQAEHAPFLTSLPSRVLTATFPTTTATSLASLGTGLPPGEHGITGYTTKLGAGSEPVNWLTYRRAHSGTKLLDDFPPEQVQPRPTAFERAESAGAAVTVVSSHLFRGSGLTRAVLRGGTYRPTYTGADLITHVAEAATPDRSLVYGYFGDLDLIGHVHGPNHAAWNTQLALIDHLLATLAAALPADTRLLITADHGMVTVPDSARIDYDTDSDLSADVAMLAGEARVRYIHVQPGRADAVRERWVARLGDRWAVLSRDAALETGWFGATITPTAAGRIGDLVALSTSNAAMVRTRAEPRIAAMRGHHGSLSEDELLVPLLEYG